MAQTQLIAVDGMIQRGDPNPLTSILGNRRKLNGELIEKCLYNLEWLERYVNEDLENSRCNPRYSNVSHNFVNYIQSYEIGNNKLQKLKVSKEFGPRMLLQNNLLKELEFPLKKLNKVFCSAWLNDRQILFGTKCNKLIVLDVKTKKMVQIPSLKSSHLSYPSKNPCGIHALKINPSGTLVATGALNSNDVSVYKLPTLDPLVVGEGGHKDWVFDITWLDDEFFVSGSRDTTIALWRVVLKDIESQPNRSSTFPCYARMKPLCVKVCKNAEKVRALLYNENQQELVALSLNAYLHLWDAQTFKQKFSRKLSCCLENVCLSQQLENSLYAVGSRSHVTLIDNRTLKPAKKVPSNYQSCGIRSLSFLGDLLTIGTGVGVVLFYDIRANKYLEHTPTPEGIVSASKKTKEWRSPRQQALLKATRGWVYPEEHLRDYLITLEYNPAIYTHCYDRSGTRLFAAGGPLPASLQGNYAGLWQ